VLAKRRHDEWWDENQRAVEEMNVSFDGHACMTSWKGRDYRYEYKESARKVWKLVKEHYTPEPWTVPLDWALAQKEVEGYMVNFSSF
jgi:hypothetical protein